MKRFYLVALTVIGLAATAYASVSSGESATNCRYTGNSSDYCYTSNGTNNLKVLNCKPGTSNCYY